MTTYEALQTNLKGGQYDEALQTNLKGGQYDEALGELCTAEVRVDMIVAARERALRVVEERNTSAALVRGVAAAVAERGDPVGGFAGTIQAFVQEERLDAFRGGIEMIFGKGSCRVLRIRPRGGCAVTI